MACCLAARGCYLNQCLLFFSKVHLHSSDGIIIRRSEDTNSHPDLPGASELSTPKQTTYRRCNANCNILFNSTVLEPDHTVIFKSQNPKLISTNRKCDESITVFIYLSPTLGRFGIRLRFLNSQGKWHRHMLPANSRTWTAHAKVQTLDAKFWMPSECCQATIFIIKCWKVVVIWARYVFWECIFHPCHYMLHKRPVKIWNNRKAQK